MITSQQGAFEKKSHCKKANPHIDRYANKCSEPPRRSNVICSSRKVTLRPNKELAEQFRRESLLPLVVLYRTERLYIECATNALADKQKSPASRDARINKASTTVRCITLWNISDKNNVHTRRKFLLYMERRQPPSVSESFRYHLA